MRSETEPTDEEILQHCKDNEEWEPFGSEEYRFDVTEVTV